MQVCRSMHLMLGGKDLLLVEALVNKERDSPWNSGKGADGQREAHGVWKGDGSASWAASFVGQKGEPSLAVLLRPWIYD